jgi:hypothetical protein
MYSDVNRVILLLQLPLAELCSVKHPGNAVFEKVAGRTTSDEL